MESGGNGVRVPFLWVIALLLTLIGSIVTLMGSMYMILDTKKADRAEVLQMQGDIREIRVFITGRDKR